MTLLLLKVEILETMWNEVLFQNPAPSTGVGSPYLACVLVLPLHVPMAIETTAYCLTGSASSVSHRGKAHPYFPSTSPNSLSTCCEKAYRRKPISIFQHPTSHVVVGWHLGIYNTPQVSRARVQIFSTIAGDVALSPTFIKRSSVGCLATFCLLFPILRYRGTSMATAGWSRTTAWLFST